MTREEAIEFGNTILMFAEQEKDSHTYEFTKMAVEALSAEPCEDCITLRLEKGALKYSDKDYVVYKKEWLKKWWQPELALLGIELPNIQPIRPKGEWIGGVMGWECSHCGYGVFIYNNTDFCPNCGADMRGTE